MSSVTSVTKEVFCIQAEPAGYPGGWLTLPGFCYATRQELDGVYEEYFRRIDGQGNRYRRVRITVSERMELL